jgi:transcriptional regulator of acetoin/glycerol metabolism
VILCRDSEIGIEHLPAGFLAVNRPEQNETFSKRKRPSKDVLQSMLTRYSGNRKKIAHQLGVDRTTLWRWMKRYQLNDD